VGSATIARRLATGLPAWTRPVPGGLLVAAATLAIGWHAKAFRGFPKGYDALGHLAKIHLLLSSFPHVNWNSAWYSGAPYFAGSYPPGYHAAVATLAALAEIPASQSMVVVASASMLMITLGLYGLVRAVTGRTLSALIAVALVLGGPTQWSQILQFGLYPRLLGMGLAAVALALAASCARRPSRPKLVVTILALAASGSVHPLTAVLGGVLVAVVMLMLSGDRYQALLQVGTVGVASLALAGYFYVPYVLQPIPQSLFNPALKPVPWSSLVRVSGPDLAAWSPVLIPAVLVCVVRALLVWRRLRVRAQVVSPELLGVLLGQSATSTTGPTVQDDETMRRALRTAATLAAAAMLLVIYCLAGHFKHPFDYLQGLDPQTLLTYPEWLLAAGCGIIVGSSRNLIPRFTVRFAVPAGILAACAAVGLAVVVPLLPTGALNYQDTLAQFERSFAASIPDQQQFRIVSDDPSSYEPLNIVTTSPQTGGYQDQAEPSTDFQYWLSDATSDPSWNADERLFLLDWYAAGWVFTNPGPGYARPYQSDPGKFTKLASNPYGPVSLFKVRGASPIVSVSNAPTMLFIGDFSHYETFLRALADSDIDSSRLVPVYGGSFADDIAQADLADYDTVFLYGARSHDPARVDALLSAYVQQGGRLVDDPGDQGPYTVLPLSGGSVLPVASTVTRTTAGSWLFTAEKGMIDPASLRRFSPPSFAGTGLWQVERATRLQPGAHALLRSHDAVVLADRRVGAGLVYWSGLNLPYHVATFQNAAESELLGDLVGAAPAAVPSPASSRSVGAERISVTARGRGLLVKENWSQDWRAAVDGRVVPVETAGPGMMYIPLPRNGPADVVLTYHLSDVELAGIALSLVAVIALVAAALPFWAGARIPGRLRARLEHAQQRLTRRLLPGTTAIRATREALQEVLADPSAKYRRRASTILRGEPLQPYADLLLQAVRAERDPACLSELRSLVVETQWEPQASPAVIELRRWAAAPTTTSPWSRSEPAPSRYTSMRRSTSSAKDTK